MIPRVLVTENIHQVGWDTLRAEEEAVAWPGQEKQPLIEAVRDVHGVVVRVAKLTPDVIRAATSLKIIGKHGGTVTIYDSKGCLLKLCRRHLA